MSVNRIDLSELRNEKQVIYRDLWADKNFDFKIIKTGKKDFSYEFEFAGKNLVEFVGESVANNFGIDNEKKTVFIEKFKMACSGTGDELKKITTLHSSSLCALLFFFDVDERPLKLHDVEFTKSFFEFKNKVIGYPSNIDVVLLGRNLKTNKKVLLFLESKFSEYITGINKANSQYEIGSSYFKENCFSAPIYKKMVSEGILIYNAEKSYFSSTDDKYIEGLKQIVSHYYGIRNFLDQKFYTKDNEHLDEIRDYGAEEYLLGEILFNNFNDELKQKYLIPYEKDYNKLAKIINIQCENEKKTELRVLEDSLRYSDLKDYISVFPKIHDFYFGVN